MKKITLSLVAILSLAFASSTSFCFDYKPLSEQASKQLKTLDQPYAFFKSFGKFPFLSHYHPAKDEMTTVLCGTKKEGVPTISKRPSDLMNLTPVRLMQFRFYCGQQVNKVYDGYRDTVIGGGLDSLLRSIKVLPNDSYRGTLLVDEYQKQIPMKFVVRNTNDLTAICKYLQKNFADKKIQPHAQKPVLVVSFLDGNKELHADLSEFLSTYYELADAANPEVKRFFQYGHRIMCKKNKIGRSTCKVFTGETFMEQLFREFEAGSKKFKLKVCASALLGFVISKCLMDPVKKSATARVQEQATTQWENLSDNVKNVLMFGSLAAISSVIAYSIFDFYGNEDIQKIDLGELNELELPLLEAVEDADAA